MKTILAILIATGMSVHADQFGQRQVTGSSSGPRTISPGCHGLVIIKLAGTSFSIGDVVLPTGLAARIEIPVYPKDTLGQVTVSGASVIRSIEVR